MKQQMVTPAELKALVAKSDSKAKHNSSRREALEAGAPVRNKYGVSKPEERTYLGVVYRSKAERMYAEHLEWRKQRGLVVAWEPKPKRFPFIINGVQVGWYTPDFTVWSIDPRTLNEDVHWVDVKGYAVRDFVFRVNVFRALYPAARLELVNANDVRKLPR